MRYFLQIHKILGTILSIFFLMWFCTGLVMMYHTYPRVTEEQKLGQNEELDTLSLPMPQLIAGLNMPKDSIQRMELSRRGGISVLRVYGSTGEEVLDARTGRALPTLNHAQLKKIAATWDTAQPQLQDTLNAVDIWLVGVYPVQDYPVYKYAFGGKEQAELYLSSRTGEAVQYTTRSSRLWAWIGAIPHWIYIKQLRAHGRQPWTDVVLWISGIGVFMVLAGYVIGVRALLVARRQKRGASPYVKSMFRWHHLLGLAFGLFVFTFVFSGYMSLQKVPQWMVPVKNEQSPQTFVQGQPYISLADYQLDYRRVLAAMPVKRLTWTCRAGHPVYMVEQDDKLQLIDASQSALQMFTVDEKTCQEMTKLAFGTVVPVDKLMEYDAYYSNVSLTRQLPLPVYRMVMNDADQSRFYVNPVDGSTRYYNRNTHLRAILYGGLHSLNLPFFVHHPVLRLSLIWLFMLGGIGVSLTGLVLGLRWLLRKLF